MNTSEELELVQRHLLGLNSQLVIQLPLSGALHALDCGIQLSTGLTGDTQGVRAAGVGPHVGESDLLGGALLEQEAVVGIEQEDGECAVQETLINVGHQVAYCRAGRLIIGSGKLEGCPSTPPINGIRGLGYRVGMEPYRSSC